MKNSIIYLILLLAPALYAQDLSIQTGHSDGITDLVFTPDGKYLVSSGEDSKVILWDMVSSRQMQIFTGHIRTVNSLAVHPSKNWLASASDDKTVKIWEYPSGKLIKEYQFFGFPVKSVSFNPNGDELACGSDSVYLIDLKSNSVRKIGKFSKRGYNALDYSNDGKYIAYGGKKQRKVFVYNLVNNKISKRFRTHSNDLLFDEDDRFIYSAGQKGNMKRMVAPGNLGRKYNISTEGTWNSFNAVVLNDKYFIGANRDNMIYIFDRTGGARTEILKSHTDEIWALAIEPKGRYLASAGKDRQILIWDLNKFALIKSMEGGAKRINSLSFSESGKLMFIAYNDGSYRIWNLDQKGKVLYQEENKLTPVEKYKRYKYTALGSNEQINTNRILIKAALNQKDKYSDDYNAKEALIIWKLRDGLKTFTLKSPKTTDYQSFIIKDTANILLFNNKATRSQKYSYLNKQKLREREQVFNSTVYTMDISMVEKDKKLKPKGRHTQKLFTIEGDMYYKSISPDGKNLLALISMKRGQTGLQIWSLETNNMVNSFTLDEKFESAGFTNTGTYIYMVSEEDKKIKLFNPEDMSPVSEFSGISPVSFSPDDKLIAYTDEQRNIFLTEIKTKQRVFKASSGHSSAISEIRFNIPYNYIATSGHDGLIRFWDIRNGELLVNLAAFGEDDFIYINPENYYYSTKGAMNFIGFTEEGKLYTFEQFDVKFNRPDLVFSKMGYSSPEEIEAYHKAHVKRVQKMGFVEPEFGGRLNIPEVSVLNLDDIPISTTNGELSVQMNVRDSLHLIDRLNIWVNDVPVLGTNGFSVLDKNKKNINMEFPVKLSSGRNKIQVSGVNEKGFESLKETFSIIYDVKGRKPDLYLVTIGVSDYQNPSYNLQYAAKDADDITNLFKKEKNKVYGKVHNIKVLNKDATVPNILKLKSELEKTRVDDIVILFFAGHGVLDSEMNYYLATTEIDVDKMDKTALRYDYLEGLFDGIPARKKVILIDACHSGEVDKDEAFTDSGLDDNDDFVVFRDIRSAAALEAPTKISTQNTFELMKMMFADIRRGTGSTVISSAGGGEFAYETEQAKNGIFTHVLINGIKSKKADLNKDGIIMVSELRDYVSNTVSKVTKGYQNPTSRRENLEFDFRVW